MVCDIYSIKFEWMCICSDSTPWCLLLLCLPLTAEIPEKVSVNAGNRFEFLIRAPFIY